ncbi:MAG: hypothetical protein QOE96_4340 [Blastocatellia bacterium]|nr:hypothetical protein [Blastocatellia bacterium]
MPLLNLTRKMLDGLGMGSNNASVRKARAPGPRFLIQFCFLIHSQG